MSYKRITVLAVLLVALLIITTACGSAGKSEEKDGMKNPLVTLEIENRGKIKIELYPDMAPNTVNNFIYLVQQGYYDGLTFHRIVPGFVIQGGDPEGTGMGGPGYHIKGEFKNNGFDQNTLKHTRGVISMARAQHMDSAGSQFFIVLEDAPFLDNDYAAFGKVIEGMDIVDDIASVETDIYEYPLEKQVIKKATVELFGREYDEPEKIQ